MMVSVGLGVAGRRRIFLACPRCLYQFRTSKLPVWREVSLSLFLDVLCVSGKEFLVDMLWGWLRDCLSWEYLHALLSRHGNSRTSKVRLSSFGGAQAIRPWLGVWVSGVADQGVLRLWPCQVDRLTRVLDIRCWCIIVVFLVLAGVIWRACQELSSFTRDVFDSVVVLTL